jgi:sulfatase maturation enzyme AslB (radical SAM superfamily)
MNNKEKWTCAAVDHGVAIFPNGKIGPCCLIDPEYLKPISVISRTDRFADLESPDGHFGPAACQKCNSSEHNNITSYRQMFNSIKNSDANGLQFVDIRNTNLCNLKCRYCGPHFSNQWAKELEYDITLQHQSIDEYKHLLLTDSLHWMYFTGGEPMVNADHWQVLEELISSGQSRNIKLLYNSNLTSLKFKDKNIFEIWKQFKRVDILCSIDAVGEPLEYIRSGSTWNDIEKNILELLSMPESNINIKLSPVMSILNIWFVEELCEFAQQHNLDLSPIILTGPTYLSIDVIPDALRDLALDKINSLKKYKIEETIILKMIDLVTNNVNSFMFQHTLNHIMLLDKMRNEKLLEILPFKSVVQDLVLKNYEYQ